MPNLALMPIHTITHDDIQDLILAREFTTAKTLNNCLIPLRGVFDTALKSKLISENPDGRNWELRKYKSDVRPILVAQKWLLY